MIVIHEQNHRGSTQSFFNSVLFLHASLTDPKSKPTFSVCVCVCFLSGSENGRCVASEYFTEPDIEITTENTANILSESQRINSTLSAVGELRESPADWLWVLKSEPNNRTIESAQPPKMNMQLFPWITFCSFSGMLLTVCWTKQDIYLSGNYGKLVDVWTFWCPRKKTCRLIVKFLKLKLEKTHRCGLGKGRFFSWKLSLKANLRPKVVLKFSGVSL